MNDLVDFVAKFPQGVSAGEIELQLKIGRSTLNRRLREAVSCGDLIAVGNGSARRYCPGDALAAIKAYMNRPYTERSIATYQESLLLPTPALSDVAMAELGTLPAYAMTKRELSKFLIDFACASSVLEGGTYSLLDTQALIDYGEKSAGKPLADAFLVLNHKEAFEYLYDHLDLQSICKVQDLLTSDHDLAELKDTPHFLPAEQRGKVREYGEVDIRLSTYLPPYRPGSAYLQEMLDRVLKTAQSLPPVQAAFYLLTRIPYLQPFQDGNKRTSRALCNVPLLQAGLPPISFVDFAKQDYIVSLLAFYELGDVRLAERCFVAAYKKSAARLVKKTI